MQLKPPVKRKYTGKANKLRVSKNKPKAGRPRERVSKKAPQDSRLYKIYYGVMPATDLPKVKLIPYHPGYGNPIGEHGSKTIVPAEYRYRRLNAETGFYINLEKSLAEKGCINPLHALSIEEERRFPFERIVVSVVTGQYLLAVRIRFNASEGEEHRIDAHEGFQRWARYSTDDEMVAIV